MKRLLTFIIVLASLNVISQDYDAEDFTFLRKPGYKITCSDEALFSKIPELEFPEGYKNKTLPAVVDNSQYKYFRPIFSQTSYPNCMQSTSIAYNYTYEVNRFRDLSADIPENQYTTHFSWNFYNGGEGWSGVNYLHTFYILEKCGTPNVADYGGFYYGGGSRWMSGYDEYYKAMHNRIEKIYKIPTDTEEGILLLKNWLYDHLEGSEYGGVASFIACSPWNLTYLPSGTPEENKAVISSWCPNATHGMTIIGYNDSIRYDYNSDGSYTNNVDINNDGVIDPRDWEIGGFKFANSYDTSWADNGFAYMMYRTVAKEIEHGSIWSNAVHVIKLNDPYEPELTWKIKMSHNSREMIKVMAGVNPEANANVPSAIMEFPIFNYQGGDKYMQGSDTAELNKIIEFGLDITPLLSHCEANMPATFFLMIDEDDPYNEGYGELISLSLMNYTNGVNEIPYSDTNVSLVNDGRSVFPIAASINFDKPEIITDELQAYTPGSSDETLLEAIGGTPPYEWVIKKKYNCSYDYSAFPQVTANELYPLNASDSIYSIGLPFEFPFFGTKYDTIHVSRFSYMFFTDEFVYWSYIHNHEEFLRNVNCISPLKAREIELDFDNGDGLWYESTQDYIIFRWNASHKDEPESDLNMAVKLSKNGDIEFFYGDMTINEEIDWAGGISEGNGLNYHLLDYTQVYDIERQTYVSFNYNPLPDSLEIINDNILKVKHNDVGEIFDINIICRDSRDISDKKVLSLSDGILINFIADAEGDTILEFGENVKYDIELKNISGQAISNVSVFSEASNPYTQWVDQNESLGDISPGQSIYVQDALSLNLDIGIPDNYFLDINTEISSDNKNWIKETSSKVKAPEIMVREIEVDDDNGRLDPGEASDIIIPLHNKGHASTNLLDVKISSVDNLIQITGPQSLSYGEISPGEIASETYTVFTDYAVPNGYLVDIALEISDNQGFLKYDTVSLRAGKIPALILDIDPNNYSGPGMKDILDRLGVHTLYSQSLPPGSLTNYQAIFICLGVQFNSGSLSWQQGEELAAFLDNGGRIFMEGRETWKEHLQTPVHYKFNIDPVTQAAMYYNILGIDSTFTEGMRIENLAAQPFSYYYLDAVAPAYDVFISEADSLTCGVAYDQGTYKTIGTIFEIGNLLNDSARCDSLMMRIVEFFDIVLTVSDVEEVNENPSVPYLKCYPNPFNNRANIQFALNQSAAVYLDVFSIHGKSLDVIYNGELLDKGFHEIIWKPAKGIYPPGIYFLRLRTNQAQKTIKLIINR